MLSFDSAKLKRIVLFFYHPSTPEVLIRKTFSDVEAFHSFMNEKRNLNKCVQSYSFEYECKPYDFADILSEDSLF